MNFIANSYNMSITNSYNSTCDNAHMENEIRFPEFAARFEEARKERGITGKQKELGAIIGVSGVTAHNYKTGKKMPKMERAIKIANEFGVCVEWLLTGRGLKRPEKISSRRLQHVIDNWIYLSEDTKNSFVELIKLGKKPTHEHYPEWESGLPNPNTTQGNIFPPVQSHEERLDPVERQKKHKKYPKMSSN
jgi:DNA-binding XRE family transcriptional regulator